jgi:hypothetical protein
MTPDERASLLLKRRAVLGALLEGYVSSSATAPYGQKLDAFLSMMAAGNEPPVESHN